MKINRQKLRESREGERMEKRRRTGSESAEEEPLFQCISGQAAARGTSILSEQGEVTGAQTGNTWHLSLPPPSLCLVMLVCNGSLSL